MSIPIFKKNDGVVSQEQKPLSVNDLSDIVPAMERLSERVRTRIREEMKRQKMSQRDIAGLLQWSQSRVAHILTGRVEIGVDDLAAFAFALGLSMPEVVRDRGMEFVAEMTPTELRLYERLRALGPDTQSAIMKLLNIPQADARRALPKPPPRRRTA